MIEAALGNNNEPVKSYDYKRIVKSVGNGTTLAADLTTLREIEHVVYLLSEEVAYRMRKKHLKGSCVTLSVRNADLEWIGAQETIRSATNSCKTICDTVMKIFSKIWKLPAPVHSLRVSVSSLIPDTRSPVQIDLFDEYKDETRKDKISQVLDKIRRKYGTSSVMYANAAKTDLDFEVLDEDE